MCGGGAPLGAGAPFLWALTHTSDIDGKRDVAPSPTPGFPTGLDASFPMFLLPSLKDRMKKESKMGAGGASLGAGGRPWGAEGRDI